MATEDWKEVQRLAAEFQKAQLSDSLQRLSERNCVEIISKLISLKLIDVFFTNDGKEYVTPQQLIKEIEEELYLHGGRINLTELVPLLNLSFHAIESRAQELAQNRPEVHLIAGQLIDDTYLDHICEEINEVLQQNGRICLAELTKQYELSSEFLLQQLLSRLGAIVQGEQDRNDPMIFFTEGFLARNKARIRGALSAISVPTSVSSIVSNHKFPERLFFAVAEDLISTKRIKGSISGGRQASIATYIPEIYSRSQNEYCDNFLKQNGYLGFDTLVRLGISDPKAYCSKRFKDSKLLFLASCCVGSGIFDQVEAAIEEALSSQSWVDVATLLPSVFEEEDIQQIIQNVLKDLSNQYGKALTVGNTVVASESLVHTLKTVFDPLIKERAEEVVLSGVYQQSQAESRNLKQKSLSSNRQDMPVSEKKDRKEERRKKASEGKVGGGVQGRETKTRSTKKKYLRGKNDSDDDAEDDSFGAGVVSSNSAPVEIEGIPIKKVVEMLKKQEAISDAPDEFVVELASRLHKLMQASFLEAAQVAYEAHLSSSSGQRRRTHGEIQEKLENLIQTVKRGCKAILCFDSLDLQQQLVRHLLKTCATEFVNEAVLYVVEDSNVPVASTNELTNEARLKLIGGFPPATKSSFLTLHKSVQGSSIDEFLAASEAVLVELDIMQRKPDKKKEKLTLTAQRQSLIEQLSSATDAALSLHLAVLLLFHSVTQTSLCASGRFVPQIVSYLQLHLPAATYETLTALQSLVIQEITAKGDQDQLDDIRDKMRELIPRVRELAVTFKKKAGATDA